MGRVICITGTFDVYDERGRPTGRQEFAVSHGVDEVTLKNVVLPSEHPARLGAALDKRIGEWVLPDADAPAAMPFAAARLRRVRP